MNSFGPLASGCGITKLWTFLLLLPHCSLLPRCSVLPSGSLCSSRFSPDSSLFCEGSRGNVTETGNLRHDIIKVLKRDMVSIESIWTNVIFQTRHCTTSLWCHVMPYSVSREQPKATQKSWWTHVVIQTDVSFPVASYSFTTLWSPLYFLPLFLSHILYTLCYCIFSRKETVI